jgi:hypothetical protein
MPPRNSADLSIVTTGSADESPRALRSGRLIGSAAESPGTPGTPLRAAPQRRNGAEGTAAAAGSDTTARAPATPALSPRAERAQRRAQPTVATVQEDSNEDSAFFDTLSANNEAAADDNTGGSVAHIQGESNILQPVPEEAGNPGNGPVNQNWHFGNIPPAASTETRPGHGPPPKRRPRWE